MRHCLAALLLVFAAFAKTNVDTPIDPEVAIRCLGNISIIGGPYFYIFREDGSFESGPAAMTESGRTIEGRWYRDPKSRDVFTVYGKWEFINGLTPNNDFRRITFKIGPGLVAVNNEGDKLFPSAGKLDNVFAGSFLVGEAEPLSDDQDIKKSGFTKTAALHL